MPDINLQIVARGTNVSAQRRENNVVVEIDNTATEAATVAAGAATATALAAATSLQQIGEQVEASAAAALDPVTGAIAKKLDVENPQSLAPEQQAPVRAALGAADARAIGWVTPEQFGAVGDGDIANAGPDTLGLQAAVDTGMPVFLRPGANYRILASIRPPVGLDLIIQGRRKSGNARSRLTAVPGFTGWMLFPRQGYDIQNVYLEGTPEDGCYLLGSNDPVSSGLAVIINVYLANADLGIYFGGEWEHPWGVQYDQINGINFRTGGIHLGGITEPASSGESAWSMDNINLNASPSWTGIAAPSQVVSANTPSATFDRITWDNSTSPLYGWCVMRSANGSTGWHVPPNWTSPGLMAGTFDAQKVAGETWVYQVVRMTRGVHIRRGKAISMGVVQAEYFGIGLYYGDGSSLSVNQFYMETRDRSVPLPMFCGIFANNAWLDVGGGWIEQAGYGVVSNGNAQLNISGPLRVNNCKWGKAAQGGSTTQAIRHFAPLRATGTTPDTIVPFNNDAQNFIRAGVEQGTDGSMTSYVDGTAGSRQSVRRRGAEKAAQFVNADGEGETKSDRLSVALPNKTIKPSFINNNQRTSLTPGTATAFLDLTVGADSAGNFNASAGISIDYDLEVLDAGIVRQSAHGRVSVACSVTPGSPPTIRAGTSSSVPAKALQAGTLGDPDFTVSVSGGVVTVNCLVTSSIAGATARIYVNSVVHTGGASLAIVAR